jgi:four helix bundle protein
MSARHVQAVCAMGVGDFRDLRAWQLARTFKLGIYRLVAEKPLANDFKLRDQLRDAAASAPANISEGYGRFDPADFARFVKVAKASLRECQNHLQDAVDRGYISEAVRQQHAEAASEALKEIAGLLDYLQAPEARRNAERIRQQRIARRRQRVAANKATNRNPEPEHRNPEQQNPEQQNPEQQNPEQQNPEQQNPEQQNPEQQNPEQQNPEQQNPEHRNREPGTRNRERSGSASPNPE